MEEIRDSIFMNLQLQYGGQLTDNKPGLFSGFRKGDITTRTISGKYDGAAYSIEEVSMVRKGKGDFYKFRLSAGLRASFGLVVNYCGNLDFATEKLNWVLQGGGFRRGEFWIKSNKPELAKAFCDENELELKKLVGTGIGGYADIEGVRIKDWNISVYADPYDEQKVREKFETIIAIAKKYR